MSNRITLKSSLIALAVVATLACNGSQAHAQQYVGSFEVKNWGTGMYMEDAFTYNGGEEFQDVQRGDSAEVYSFYRLHNGTYAIVNDFSGLALTDTSFEGQSTAEQFGFVNNIYQEWYVIEVVDGAFAIINAGSGKALTDPSYNRFSGIITYEFFYSELQLWYLD